MLSLEKSSDSQFASLSKIKSCVRRPEESPIRAPEPFRAQDGIQLVQQPGDRAPAQRHLARPPGRLSAAIIAARYVPRSPGPGYSTAGTVRRPRAARSPPWRALPNRDAVQAARPGQVIERSPRNQPRPPATPRPGPAPGRPWAYLGQLGVPLKRTRRDHTPVAATAAERPPATIRI